MTTKTSRFSRTELPKRIAELRCLYGVASAAADTEATLEEQAARIVGLLREAFHDHQAPFSRITIGEREFTSGRVTPDTFTMTADIIVAGKRAGSVTIGYRDGPAAGPEPDECGPEALLLNAVAERLGGLIERHRNRAKLARARRNAAAFREVSRMKSDLLATVSHELRTPLTSLKGYATMTLDHYEKLTSKEIRENLAAMDAATDRLKRLVDNLLETSRLEAGLTELDGRTGDLRGLIEEVVTEARLRSPGHAFTTEVTNGAGRAWMDERRLREVLDNLVENAVKYSPGGGIEVTAKKNGAGIDVCVSDEGPGIPPKELAHVFKRMHRIDRHGADGLGLGLYLCRKIIEAHGGTIRAANRPQGGAAVTFTLPCRERTGAT